MPRRGVGGARNPEAGSDPGFSATPFTYRQSKRGGVVHGYWDPFPHKRFRIYAKLRSVLDMKVNIFATFKSKFSRESYSSLWPPKRLLPELWQNPETAVENNNFPILLEHLCGDSEWVSALKQAQEIPLLPSEPFVAFVEQLTSAIELQVKKEGAQEQVLEEMALDDENEQRKAAILSLPMDLAPTLDGMLQVCAKKVPFMTGHQSHSSRVKPPQKAAAADTVPPVTVPRQPPK
ncbi:hypothetical protein DUI87_03929 [Hirundo rustica rustica]|uniref:Uncharacterized protein n=1 Tax=Hirundo rustica rustica TaxID=333673 RepID=A0A3M0L2S2_HIRRU|nr:hypothetical protein DUI87_03929 [Hirundo rustica rustica]